MRKIDTVLFDFDGTLLSTEELVMESFRYTLSHYGVENVSEERLRRTFGGLIDDIMREFIDEYGIKAGADEMVEYYRAFHNKKFDTGVFIYDGIKELLISLKNDEYKTAVLTSRKKYSTYRGLEIFGIKGYFDVIQTADDTDKVKPDPLAAKEVTDMLGSNIENTIIIGDSSYDILCGKNAGMYTALARWGTSMPEAEIKELNPDIDASTPAELLREIVRINGR